MSAQDELRQDGSALIYSDGSTLYKIAGPDTNPEPGQGGYETAIIDIESGDVVTLDGRDLWAGPTYTAKRTTLLLAEDVASTPGQTQTLTAVDATTADSVGEFEYTVPDHRGFSQSSWGNDRGDMEVVAFSPDSMWRLVDEAGSPTLERIEPPPIDPDASHEAVLLTLSPDGYMTLRIFEDEMQFTTWLMVPGSDEWIQLELPTLEESQGMLPTVSFIRGAD